MSAACCRSSTHRSQISSPASGCLSSCMPGRSASSCNCSAASWWCCRLTAVSPVCLQRPALPGLSVFPDVGSQGFGEVGRLAPDLHHLPAERRHRKPGVRHLPALQSRGTAAWQRHAGSHVLRSAFMFLTLNPPTGGFVGISSQRQTAENVKLSPPFLFYPFCIKKPKKQSKL